MAPSTRSARSARKRSATDPLENSPTTSQGSSNIIGSESNSNANSNDAINRLTNIMANFIVAQGEAARRPIRNYDSVPLFDPANKDQPIDKWCAKVDELSLIFNWTPEMTIHAALSRLDGLAKTWYQGLRTVKYTWLEWKEKLKVAFPPSKDFYQKLAEMMARRKLPDESFARYYYEKLALLNACEIEGVKAVDCIIGGISDPSVVNSAKAGQHQTPEALFVYLSTVLINSDESNHSLAKKRYDGAYKDKSADVVCHKCGKKGHIAKKCYKHQSDSSGVKDGGAAATDKPKLHCDFCQRDGHTESHCFRKKAQSNSKNNKVQ